MKTTTKTRTIAGCEITLEVGIRYLATRPTSSSRWRKAFPITIQPMVGEPVNAMGMRVADLDYDGASAFLAAFNDGKATFFGGRVW